MLIPALLFSLVLTVVIARRPMAVDPAYVDSSHCTVSEEKISLELYGPYNPRHLKEWKITARYETSNKTLYVTCWLKADLTFRSFSGMSLSRKEYGEIDRIVLEGGCWMNGRQKVLWEAD